MYNGAGAINTGVPGALVAYTTASSWGVLGGVVLALVGGLNVLLAVRASRVRERVFPGA